MRDDGGVSNAHRPPLMLRRPRPCPRARRRGWRGMRGGAGCDGHFAPPDRMGGVVGSRRSLSRVLRGVRARLQLGLMRVPLRGVARDGLRNRLSGRRMGLRLGLRLGEGVLRLRSSAAGALLGPTAEIREVALVVLLGEADHRLYRELVQQPLRLRPPGAAAGAGSGGKSDESAGLPCVARRLRVCVCGRER